MSDVKKIVNDLFSFVKENFYYVRYFLLLVGILAFISLIGIAAILSAASGPFGPLLLVLLLLIGILLLLLLIPPIYFALLQRSLVRMGYSQKLSSLFYPLSDLLELLVLNIVMFITPIFNWLETRVLIGQLVLYFLAIVSILFTFSGDSSSASPTSFILLISIASLVYLYIHTRLSLAPQFFLSRKELGPTAAIRESYTFTNNRFWEVFMFNNCGGFLAQLLCIALLVPLLILLVLVVISFGLQISSISAAAPIILIVVAVFVALFFFLYLHFCGVFFSITNARIFDILLKSKPKESAPVPPKPEIPASAEQTVTAPKAVPAPPKPPQLTKPKSVSPRVRKKAPSKKK